MIRYIIRVVLTLAAGFGLSYLAAGLMPHIDLNNPPMSPARLLAAGELAIILIGVGAGTITIARLLERIEK